MQIFLEQELHKALHDTDPDIETTYPVLVEILPL